MGGIRKLKKYLMACKSSHIIYVSNKDSLKYQCFLDIYPTKFLSIRLVELSINYDNKVFSHIQDSAPNMINIVPGHDL